MAEEKFDPGYSATKVEAPQPVKKGHTCSVCQKWFKRSSDLRRHGSVHTNEKPISCDHCNLKFKTKDRLRCHLKYLNRKACYQCDFCKKCFKFKSNLQGHCRIHHTHEKPYRCEMCNKSFPTRDYLHYHYGSRTYLQHHRQFEEFKEFEYLVGKHDPVISVNTCIVCNKQFKTVYQLRNHSVVHSGDKYECDICGLGFSRDYIKRHKILAHSENKKFYSCDICNKTYNTEYKLKLHKSQHDQEKPFKCDMCLEAFGLKTVLTKHMRNFHNIKNNNVCHICNKRYKTVNGLKRHMNDHTGERRYMCPHCEKRFKTSTSVERHYKICKELKSALEAKVFVDLQIELQVPKNEKGEANGKLDSALLNETFTQNNIGHSSKSLSGEASFKLDSAPPNETCTQSNIYQSLSKNLSAAKDSFKNGNNVFVSKNLKIIKVQNAAKLNLLKIPNLFRMYR